MSKHLLEACQAMMHPVLMQSASTCDEAACMALDIRLMDLDEDGNLTSNEDTRYVRLSDSTGRDQILPLCLKHGEGYVRLEDLQGVQFTLVQCDEQGNQLLNGDAYGITYQVDGVHQEEDYARGRCPENTSIMIINMPATPSQLHIVKTLYNEFHEPIECSQDMNFTLHVQGCGTCETIDLNEANHFQCCMEQLKAGIYEIWEETQPCYHAMYALDGAEPMEQKEFHLLPGTHTLEVQNTMQSSATLMIDHYLRDACGELIKPQNDACFHVRLISDYYDAIIELNKDNDFAVELCDLPTGLYDVMELDQGGYDVSYLVNSGLESNYAQVEVQQCRSASVLIINSVQVHQQNCPLRICKFVRRSDQCLVQPDPMESFKVMLSGCGVCEIFNLNASNNFCVDIEHICCGEYEVQELDHSGYVASYIVNEECESTQAHLWIHEGGQNCVTIINEERNKGEVTICKVIRQKDGTITKPDKSARFLISLRSFFARESFVLDASNDFCIHVYHLKEGSYEVKERKVEGYETRYRINGEKEERKARFTVMNGTNTDVKIINNVIQEPSGDLRICKYIANAYGDYVKPSVDEEFNVMVEGPCFKECYSLRSANNWCIVLEGLKKGVYRISEQSCSRYETSYYVNGCAMEEAALVCMEAHNQEVSIINTRTSNGNLKLSLLVEDCDKNLRKPNPTEFFEVLVETKEGSKEICLDEHNNFTLLMENLPQGSLRITQKDSYGYRVLYEIDGERRHDALLSMDGEMKRVTIINQMMGCAGIVRVNKLIETSNGRLVRPCAQDAYCFELRSRCHTQEVTLKEQNDFCVLFDDLEEGEYEIVEHPQSGMKTRYRINEAECEHACFTLSREDVDITIINQVLPQPTLCVQKRIKMGSKLCKPQAQESFYFQLISKGLHETYCLNQANDWCVCLDGLSNQHYEVREINENCHTMYQINDCLYKQGNFLFDDQDVEITIINEAPSEALLNIKKMVRDVDGSLHAPCGQDQFDITLENECFKQCFCLKKENQWCVQIAGLMRGVYTITENNQRDNFEVWIDGECLEENDITLADEDVNVMLVNPCGCDNSLVIQASVLCDGEQQLPDAQCSYHVSVEHENLCDTFCLNEENEWCIELANITLGTYRIFAQETLLYESDGVWFENCIELDLGCEQRCVNLIDEREGKHTITITKRIQEEDGSLRLPPCGSTFPFILQGSREECFALSEDNNWQVVLEGYPCGTYEIEETLCDVARFKINGVWQTHGRFQLGQNDVEIIIVNPHRGEAITPQAGSLTVHALVKNCDGDLESAPIDERFDVMIDGDGVREDITLTNRNGFQMRYDQLPQGPYVILQRRNDTFNRITYRIQGVEQPSGEIELREEDIQVDLINYQNCEHGSIRVMKYLQDATCGCLKRPCMEEEYTITLRKEGMEQSVILNASNRWSYVFEHLRDGNYTLEEEDGEGVRYIINGGKEQEDAQLTLHGEDINVKVINPSTNLQHGSIELCKYMRDENGNQHDPQREDSFWVSVSGEGIMQRVLLSSANHFYAEVRHLLPGTYEVKEETGTNVRYQVNGGKESAQARVAVNQNRNSVNIINPIQVSGSLTLVKYLQERDGTLRTPQEGSFRIHVSAPGYNNIVTLNRQNQFTRVLSNLRPQQYVIDELDHDEVSYIIDGGSQVDRAIVNVSGSHDVSILNPIQSQARGTMKLTKFIRRMNGQLIRPSKDASYQFRVSKPGFNEIYTLNQRNQWSVTLKNLANGNYVISEMENDGRVSYIINDGSETDFGIVAVNNNDNIVSIINSETSSNGSMTITKYIRDASGELQQPQRDFTTRVRISRPGYNEIITLNQDNGWRVRLVDLLDGDYVLNEVESDDQVTWRINGGYEVRYAIVTIAHNDNQVDMIDSMMSKGSSLHLQKFIRNAMGQLVKPQDQESFTILISGAATMRIVLDVENQWMAQLDHLENGTYHIQETNSAYDVSYMIEGGEERPNATIQLQDQQVSVNIINAMRGSRNVLEISKLIKSESGTLQMPTDQDRFQVQVRGNAFNQLVTLDASNHFTERLTNLPNGIYNIQEVSQNDVLITYRINGGQELSSASVSISEGKNNVVEIINERNANGNIVDVYKYMMDAEGNFQKPTASQVFRFLLTGNDLHQFYTLNSANDWHVQISSLPSGEYEIIEQGNGPYLVQYLVNGTQFSDTGEFKASGGNETIVEIVNSNPQQKTGRITLEKKIRNQDGDLIIPGNGESFMFRVYHQATGFDQSFTLDADNGYTLTIEDLAFGSYSIEEIDTTGYLVTYIVNDGKENSQALVKVQDAMEQNVLIINTQTAMFFHVANQDDLHVVIE